MRRQAVKVSLYPTDEQIHVLAQHFGCARWWWNYGLNQCIETYKATGKGLSQSGLNSLLPKLKKDYEGDYPTTSNDGKVIGIDLGIKDFAITYDGEKVSKYPNPRHLSKYEKKLAVKQRIAARKNKGSNRRKKANKIVARVYEQVSNVRQDYLHKLSRKIVDNN